MTISQVAGFLALSLASVCGAQLPYYVGTYTDHSESQGIYLGTVDTATGRLGPMRLAAAAIDPSFLALRPDGGTLYAADERPGAGRVQAFRRAQSGGLLPINDQSANGTGTCHVSVDPSGRDLLVANYGSGSIACFQLRADGGIGKRTASVQFAGSGPHAGRQEGPHAHSIYVSPDDAFVYACDLGSDRVWIFTLNAATGKLAPAEPPSVAAPPGSGPRHLVFAREGKLLFVTNELGHSVSVFSRDASTGRITLLQTCAALPAGVPTSSVTTAELDLHPSGKWLYVSNRGSDTMAVFNIGTSGRLQLSQSIPAGVKGPRSFAVEPNGHWLIVAGQTDNRLAVFQIDSVTGRLRPTGMSTTVPSPVCVLFTGRT